MLTDPLLTARHEDGREIPLLLWRTAEPMLAVSSGPLGGGIGPRHWVINATVPMSYRRDDPDAHLAEVAARLGLAGPGVGLLTGVDVARVESAADAGVRVWATVGLGAPIWAAAPEPRDHDVDDPAVPVGTVNIVVSTPVRLSDAALVNAVATATEAKAQALWELGLPATGTATDAVTILCPVDGPSAAYGGPRSAWGARIARATHRAVLTGGAAERQPDMPWSVRHDR
ncbi:Adenosylcobinamide amidohydrolase [Micromonospora pattaloongensis]|uniref:Adenosylcobinamide amidohydrolase n=1 Tax=Micromonospora pattaloongensis TaxID=405436 RepID=A0A1H3HE80_9ACTN|nr:adenosylcobinamide amidohydrolase [Micromonospora pattaloongensis]SDY12959.1 Adenosylcobinamide amidohydrolase [Micromonospora pattaloongensis]